MDGCTEISLSLQAELYKGLRGAANPLHSGCLTLFLFFPCSFSIAVPLLQRWDENRLPSLYVHFTSAGLGLLGDLTTLSLQPALYFVRSIIQIVG